MNDKSEYVQRAEAIAREAHKHQKRTFNGLDKDKPYIVHVQRVAEQVKNNPILEAIAWLHDIVEDTKWTIDDLRRQGMPLDVICGVSAMTKVEGESYCNYIMRVKNCDVAVPVKIADLRDNLSTLPKTGFKSMRDKYELALYVLTFM